MSVAGPNNFQIDTSAVTQFDYDALDDRGRRRPAKSRTASEDYHLKGSKRRSVQATTRDVYRNFTLVKWMVRKHLDYVTRFRYQAQTKDEGLNRDLEEFIEIASGRQSFDIAGRHPLRRGIRLLEACATVDGDAGWLKYARGQDRGKVQIIESDLICLPGDTGRRRVDREHWHNGVRIDPKRGKALEYAICTRGQRGSQLNFERTVAARNMIMRGYYDRADQVRGVGPIVTALNHLRDLYEGFDYALAKIKLSQLFGLKIMRSADSVLEEEGGTDAEATDYSPDLGGPFKLDMDPGDDADFLEAKTPATETVNFLKLIIMVCLKAIDAPYSFFDDGATNFYGSRGGLIQYLMSCATKRDDNQEVLDSWTRWNLGLAVASGDFLMPSGMEFSDLRSKWIPNGVPWWDPAKEIRGQLMGIRAGLTSPQRVCQETGTSFQDNVRELAEALKYAESQDVALDFGGKGGLIDVEALQALSENQQAGNDDE